MDKSHIELPTVPVGSSAKGPASPPDVPLGGVTLMVTGTCCPVAHQACFGVKATDMAPKETRSVFRLQKHTENAEGNLLPEATPVPSPECVADPCGTGTSQGWKAPTVKAVEVIKPGKNASASGSGTPSSFSTDG